MIIKALVSDPGAVDVRAVAGERGVLLIEVQVAQADMSRIIGRQGRTVRALRTVLQAASTKHNARYVLDIVEEQEQGGAGNDGRDE